MTLTGASNSPFCGQGLGNTHSTGRLVRPRKEEIVVRSFLRDQKRYSSQATSFNDSINVPKDVSVYSQLDSSITRQNCQWDLGAK
ncbi:hypothetical protein RRG08_018722 [Elysia crispata]|uniref:Uncharacterized protein n=1 Tax=Elysia crispata TaxID=231223 RepID=A0AAE0XPP1_9GAST|nr:hypothetical protein RRG08_018722 [Elysia crispata]